MFLKINTMFNLTKAIIRNRVQTVMSSRTDRGIVEGDPKLEVGVQAQHGGQGQAEAHQRWGACQHAYVQAQADHQPVQLHQEQQYTHLDKGHIPLYKKYFKLIIRIVNARAKNQNVKNSCQLLRTLYMTFQEKKRDSFVLV